MPADYRNTGRLFKNKYKEPGDNKPNYTGDMTMPDGTKMRLAAWIKESKEEGGDKWMSIKVSSFDSQERQDSDQY
jgi:hypothetical protein